MTTEAEARALLERAAATIEVGDGLPPVLAGLGEPPAHAGPRRLPAVAVAAAAVVAVVGLALVLSAQLRGGDELPAPARTPIVTERSDGPPSTGPEEDIDQREDHVGRAAETFRAWATGQWLQPPPFADEVRLLLQDDSWGTLSRIEASRPERWAMCSGVASSDCALDPLRLLRAAGDDVQTFRSPGSVCGTVTGTLPDDLRRARADDLARLTREAGCADIWHVELWVDDAGQIYAVNLLVSPSGALAP